jgi:predicted HD superfamily hydrolase involved in NAD metabolism
MSEKRRTHTYAVAEEAKKLAQQYGEDMEKAELAALFHDLFRGVGKEELNEYVGRLGLASAYLDNPDLAHGKIAACVMEREFYVADRDIINAVSFHTTGRADMSRLEKILYLADAIEPNRDYPGAGALRELAYKDLDQACLAALERTIEHVTGKGLHLDRHTLEARDSLAKSQPGPTGRKRGEEREKE